IHGLWLTSTGPVPTVLDIIVSDWCLYLHYQC
ncbi:hypothetical protein A2U01_0065263, partial [Trifolium medium]|nr:hypothetical protein [Trifolium medium]